MAWVKTEPLRFNRPLFANETDGGKFLNRPEFLGDHFI